ncbi:TetR/AcrR family transcriptional regulator [Mycolicibacterium vaccae]|uniref:TetR/AcrR family transcriptional regulator n=1 Tax=Mycolicibacterium vaccae TaxID=1810 RepID=UPI003CEEDC9C
MKRSGSRSEATATALVEAALQIIRESGVKSVTHRKVCSYAGVALGSSTYHYENLDNLILDAFSHYVASISIRYEKHFEGATSDEDLIDAVLELVSTLTTDMGNAILEWELFAEAGRQDAYRELGHKWSSRARAAVERYVSPKTAHMLETIWDGATVQRVVNGTQMSDADIRELLRAALELDPTRGYPRQQETSKRKPAKKAVKKTAKKAVKKTATRRKAS